MHSPPRASGEPPRTTGTGTGTGTPPFAGDKKVGQSILHRPERALVAWGTPRIPRGVETYHLTLLTILFSGVNLWLGVQARGNLQWLWLVSLMIVLQYVTDLFDGAIGRARNTGLIKWGFYMDHFLDYIFLGSLVMVGYLVAPADAQLGIYYVVLLILTGGFMVSSFLSFASTNQFEIFIYGLGPTETRLGIIAINTLIIVTGTGHFRYTVPLLCVACAAGLVAVVWRTSTTLWALDMAAKDASNATPGESS